MTSASGNLRWSGAVDGAASPLVWATLLSVVLHGVMVAVPYSSQGGGTHATFVRSIPINAMLSAPAAKAFFADPVLATVGVTPEPVVALHLSSQSAAIQAVSPAAPMRVGNGVAGGFLVEPQSLQDRTRVGDLLGRQMAEFPAEVDLPVRQRDPIAVRYPTAALGAGREGSVVIWIVVGPQGKAEEVQVVDGPEEFSGAVLDALRDVYFLPAQNNRRLIALTVTPGIRSAAPRSAR